MTAPHPRSSDEPAPTDLGSEAIAYARLSVPVVPGRTRTGWASLAGPPSAASRRDRRGIAVRSPGDDEVVPVHHHDVVGAEDRPEPATGHPRGSGHVERAEASQPASDLLALDV